MTDQGPDRGGQGGSDSGVDGRLDVRPSAGRSRGRGNWLSRAARAPYAVRMPELALLPDDATRDHVMEELERSMRPRTWREIGQFLLAVALFLAVPGAVGYVVGHLALPALGPWNDRVFWAITFVGYVAVVYVSMRRDMPKRLRTKLNGMGIPVCMRCGYDLRGSPADSARCPECGHALSAREREALRSSAAPRGEP